MSAEQTPDIERVLAEHRHPGEFLAGLGDAWLVCSCGERIDLPVRDNKVNKAEVARLFEAHQAQALAPVLAAAVRDAEQRAWDEGYVSGAADWDGITLTKREISAASNPYRADRIAEPQHEAATSGNESEAVMSTEHRPNGCCDYHRHVADGCCHCEGHLTSVRDTAGSWVCGRCRGGPETHAHTDSKCVYDPVWLPLDELRAESEGAGDE